MIRQRSVNFLIQNSAGKCLLQVRDGKTGICNPLKWNFFGGKIKANEDYLEAAAREIREEIGVDARPDSFALVEEMITEKEQIFFRRYNNMVEWGDIRLGEGAGVGFFRPVEILQLDPSQNTKELVRRNLLPSRG